MVPHARPSARSSRPLARLLVILALLAGAFVPTARAADPAVSFNPTFNGGAFTYGWAPALGGTFTAFTNHNTDGFGLQYWDFATNQARVSRNGTGVAKNIGSNTTVQPGDLVLLPGSTTPYVIVRYTAPAAGSYAINARFTRRSTNTFFGADVAVVQGTSVLWSRWISVDMGGLASVSTSVTLAKNDVVDFAVGPADGSNNSDAIALDATIDLEPSPGPAGAVIPFGGQRYVACLGDSAGESIAFDPVNKRTVSNDAIRNPCGGIVYSTNMFAPGLAWDQRTSTFWQISNTRVVKNYTPAGVLVSTQFTIPLTFTVPGWGLDTLETPKGIATDSNFVYVVDAGDGGVQGQIHANEWFKFTRTGTPVTSSKLTNFHANLDLAPDCIVDDVVYVPFSSPIYPGKLLIPLEHSGIQVIDPNGNFVAKFRWTDVGVPFGVKVSAFAGLTIDPTTGNLHLVENDGGGPSQGRTQVWTRLPQAAATSYVVGVGGSLPRLQYPNPGCNRPLLLPSPASASLTFGIAYRPANASVYGVDFGGGQMHRFNPATGYADRVAATGIPDIWGVAYDATRDVLYGIDQAVSPSPRIVKIDPVTGSASPLPGYVGYSMDDIAFDTVDNRIYGVGFNGVNPQLVRIDRDTGVGTLVGGTTVNTRGIEFDPVSNKLVAMTSGPSTSTLYSIDPATGAFTTLASGLQTQGWEGLAVVPVPAATSVADAPPAARAPTAELAVAPNPSRGDASIAFSLATGADVDASVYDVSGRLVRRLVRGHFAAGRHALTWDGRDGDGRTVASGVYFVRVDRGSESLVARTVRLE